MIHKEDLREVTKIIVHPGRAHLDDFMSVALALQYTSEDTPIERKVPTPEELKDATVLVFDAGGKHEPSKLNFDHHELEGPTCSFQLFLEALGIWEEFCIVHPWADRASYMDHKGPNAWAEANKVPAHLMPKIISPVEDVIISEFSEGKDMRPILNLVGKYCIDMMDDVKDTIEDMRNYSETFVTTKGIRCVKYKGEMKQRVFPAASYMLAKEYGWAVCVTPDDRGSGWSLYRFHQDSGINFKLIEGLEDVTFTHRGGFLAKVKNGANIGLLIDLSIE